MSPDWMFEPHSAIEVIKKVCVARSRALYLVYLAVTCSAATARLGGGVPFVKPTFTQMFLLPWAS